MKTLSNLFLSLLSIFIFTSCNQTQKKKKDHAEVSIEMKKLNDTLMRATITTTTKKDGEVMEDVEIIEGTSSEVKTEVEAHKNKMLHNKTHKSHEKIKKKIKLSLLSKSNSSASGMVTLTEEEGQVTLEAHIYGLSEGTHAIHIHEKADCSSEDGKSSGGHWNPTFQPHGAWGSEKGYHKGDIGNFTADSNGHGTVNFSTDQWCLDCGDSNKNLLGKAIIVHQGVDDLTSQPSGAAGTRVSCGGIIN